MVGCLATNSDYSDDLTRVRSPEHVELRLCARSKDRALLRQTRIKTQNELPVLGHTAVMLLASKRQADGADS